MDSIAELYDCGGRPMYMRLLHGNFRGFLLAQEPSAERAQMISDVRLCLAKIDPPAVADLIRQHDWRARLTGGWCAGLRGWRQFRDELGALLVESRACFAGQGYCAALACFADRESAEHLRRYLDTWLPRVDKFYDQHWALPALAWVDQRLETDYARPYLSPGGLWDSWAAAHHHDGPSYYLDRQRRFDQTLASALASFRSA